MHMADTWPISGSRAITIKQIKLKSTGVSTVDWLGGTADGGRLPQRAMLLILAIQSSFAMMSWPMLRCFSFHLRFSRSSIRITRSCSASLRWAYSNCCRACSRLTLARSWSRNNTQNINKPWQHSWFKFAPFNLHPTAVYNSTLGLFNWLIYRSEKTCGQRILMKGCITVRGRFFTRDNVMWHCPVGSIAVGCSSHVVIPLLNDPFAAYTAADSSTSMGQTTPKIVLSMGILTPI